VGVDTNFFFFPAERSRLMWNYLEQIALPDTLLTMCKAKNKNLQIHILISH